MPFADKEINRAYNRRWYAENRERHALTCRRWKLKKRYGITPEQFESLFKSQGSCCANKACRADKPGGPGYWHLDHDHRTGRIRGILCNNCNVAIGLMQDDPARLRGAAEYLE